MKLSASLVLVSSVGGALLVPSTAREDTMTQEIGRFLRGKENSAPMTPVARGLGENAETRTNENPEELVSWEQKIMQEMQNEQARIYGGQGQGPNGAISGGGLDAASSPPPVTTTTTQPPVTTATTQPPVTTTTTQLPVTTTTTQPPVTTTTTQPPAEDTTGDPNRAVGDPPEFINEAEALAAEQQTMMEMYKQQARIFGGNGQTTEAAITNGGLGAKGPNRTGGGTSPAGFSDADLELEQQAMEEMQKQQGSAP